MATRTTLSKCVVALAILGCGGGAAQKPAEPVAPLTPRADDELAPGSRSTTCSAALARVEELAGGDLSRALASGPIAGWEGLRTRERWFEACGRFTPWVRRCLVLSTVRDELATCEPGSEPWSRKYDIAGPPPDVQRGFDDCVNRATDRAALTQCDYD